MFLLVFNQSVIPLLFITHGMVCKKNIFALNHIHLLNVKDFISVTSLNTSHC